VAAEDFEVLVAGGGIGGLTAGLTAARLGRRTLVLAGAAPGGLLLSIEQIEGVPGFPDGVPGYELCPLLEEQAGAAGAEFSPGELLGLEAREGGWLASTGEGDCQARTVVLATGARLKELGVPGEERLRGKGVSHCASCDAPLLRDRVVGVVGGGDSALQEALTLAGSVAEVVIICRDDALSGQESYRRRVLEHPRIRIRHGTVVEEILGEETVTGVRARDLATGEASEPELGAVFVYVGLQPNTEPVDGVLRLDENGRIPTDGSLRTELPGLLAAGILRREAVGRAAGSAGEGAAAAVVADSYLAGDPWPASVLAQATAPSPGNGGAHA
jgi:thioredoxin reductase (NADPH)